MPASWMTGVELAFTVGSCAAIREVNEVMAGCKVKQHGADSHPAISQRSLSSPPKNDWAGSRLALVPPALLQSFHLRSEDAITDASATLSETLEFEGRNASAFARWRLNSFSARLRFTRLGCLNIWRAPVDRCLSSSC